MLRLNTENFFITSNGCKAGVLKYWKQAGYFTSPLLPGYRWSHNGEELTSGRGMDYTVEPMDINRIDFDADIKAESSEDNC